jgi:hypothetical protein
MQVGPWTVTEALTEVLTENEARAHIKRKTKSHHVTVGQTYHQGVLVALSVETVGTGCKGKWFGLC